METLVLNESWQPICRVSWRRAITLLWEGKVQIVEEYEDKWVRSVTVEIKVPSVIRFLKKVVGRRKGVRFSRENVYTRDKGRCQYCGKIVSRAEATYDHVKPRSQSGKTCWDNIVICCVPCNQKKGGRTPEQARMRLLSVPVKPKTLPNTLRLTFIWDKNMPDSWRNWIYDHTYWNGDLVEE